LHGLNNESKIITEFPLIKKKISNACVIYDNYYITTSKRMHSRTRHLKCQMNKHEKSLKISIQWQQDLQIATQKTKDRSTRTQNDIDI